MIAEKVAGTVIGELSGIIDSMRQSLDDLPELIVVNWEALNAIIEAEAKAVAALNACRRFVAEIWREEAVLCRALAADITAMGGGPEDGGLHPPGCDCDACSPE